MPPLDVVAALVEQTVTECRISDIIHLGKPGWKGRLKRIVNVFRKYFKEISRLELRGFGQSLFVHLSESGGSIQSYFIKSRSFID